jgi:signal peptidase I
MAQAITREAAQTTAQRATQAVSRAAAEAAATQAGRAAAEAAATQAGRAAATQAAKAAAEAAGRAAATQAAKSAARSAIKESAQLVASKAKSFITNTKTFSSKIARTKPFQLASQAADASVAFIKKNPKLIIGGLVVGAIAGVALDKFMKKNDKVYKIIKIKNEEVGGVFGIGGKKYLKVYYNSSDTLQENDIVVLDNTNSNSNSNGTYYIYKSGKENGASFVLLQTDGNVQNITVEGTAGDLVYKTTFESQLKDTFTDLGGDATGIFDSIVPDIPSEYWIYIYIFIALVVFVILYNYVGVPLYYLYKATTTT